MAAAGVVVATPVEELFGHLIAGKIVHTAKAYLDAPKMLGILRQENAELDTQNLQGQVDKTFRIAILDAETMALGVGQSHDAGVFLVREHHLYVEHVTHQLHALGRGGEKHVAVDAILVNTSAEEKTDAIIHFAAR